MSVKVFCKLADCVNWDNGLCSADEIRIDREGYCASYEEIPEESVDEMDLPVHVEDLGWEDDEEDLEIEELGEGDWEDLDEDEEDEDEEGALDDEDRWAS